MKVVNAKWELEQLIEMKKQLQIVGREMDYNDDNRIKKLQDFLDSINEPENVLQEKLDEVRKEFKQDNMPF